MHDLIKVAAVSLNSVIETNVHVNITFSDRHNNIQIFSLKDGSKVHEFKGQLTWDFENKIIRIDEEITNDDDSARVAHVFYDVMRCV